MKILIVSYFYAPFPNARAFRWSALAEHWAGKGHAVDVICHWTPGLAREEIVRGVRVHRAGGAWREALMKEPPASPALRAAGTRFAARSWLRRLHDLTWARLRWPDFACLWYFPARRLARRLVAQRRHQKLMTSAHPFTDHLVGQAIKREHPSLGWLADYGDPFCFFMDQTPINNQALYQSLNEAAERRVFRSADAVTVTNGSTLRRYAELFPESAGKLTAIPPLFASAPDAAAPAIPRQEGVIRLAFVGTLYRHVRNVDFLLRLFSRLVEANPDKRLELHFFGAVQAHGEQFGRYGALLGSRLFLHGLVPRPQASRAVLDADIAVSIGSHANFPLPSKLVEYAGLGKPILNLVNAPDDGAVEFLKGYPSVLTLIAGRDEDAAALERLSRFIAAPPRMEAAAIKSWIAPFGIQPIAAAYEKAAGIVDAE